MIVAQLISSTFFGGPERQILGLARALSPDCRTAFLSFAEGGKCRPFLNRAVCAGFEAVELEYDTPWLLAALRALTGHLKRLNAEVLFCQGYKADLLGQRAARRVGIPVVAISRGWTGENRKVRFYEALDRRCLRKMDRVVCVSHGQAAKVRRAGVSEACLVVIPNAIDAGRFDQPDPAYGEKLRQFFKEPGRHIVVAAGRLSPEKGFDVLVRAARLVVQALPETRFCVFGEGPLRDALRQQIAALGLADQCILAGFRSDLDGYLPWASLVVQSSHTEGMPNIILEACAAGVPVVATRVGGTAEIIEHDRSGYLVEPRDADPLASTIIQALTQGRRQEMGREGRRRVTEQFGFTAQSVQYQALIQELVGVGRPGRPIGVGHPA